MEAEDLDALIAEGLDPNDPKVRLTVTFVRWELSLLNTRCRTPDASGLDFRASPVVPTSTSPQVLTTVQGDHWGESSSLYEPHPASRGEGPRDDSLAS